MKFTPLYKKLLFWVSLLTIAGRIDLHAQTTVSDYATGLKAPMVSKSIIRVGSGWQSKAPPTTTAGYPS